MGVIPPEEREFLDTIEADYTGTASVSSPAEGLIVLDPPKIINELTGKEVEMPQIDPLAELPEPVLDEPSADTTNEENSSKKKKKK